MLAGPPPASAAAVTVLLHGRGRATGEMIALAERIALPEMSYVTLAAPGGSWYPESFLAPIARNQPQLDEALAAIEAVVCDLERLGKRRERIALLGFSQGACLASEYLWRNPGRWGALVAFTGGLIGPPGTLWEPVGSLRGTPVLLATSDVDTWVPFDRVKETAEIFRALRAAVDLRAYAGMEHLVNDDEIAIARHILRALLDDAGADGRGARA